ncbi:potassium channel family protein [Natronorubrum halophilum]|uniref:potassium channel family protein n=1 Tax=Natronorubrum halophilum TaxID=1702106 RepID=UPI0010C22DD6|nr:TrkA C-terminal domain-containing protein [Natronorubrum halophilum]
MEEIAYRPQNVRETLVELKNASELAVDLGYAAALYDYPGLAEEVLELESRADSLQYPAKIALMLAAKRSADAEQLVGIVQIVEAAVGITNAAADIAAIVVNDIGVPEEVRATLPDADEVVMRAIVSDDCDAIGDTLGELAFESDVGVDVIAIRRGSEWNIAPGEEAVINAGDIVIGSGSVAGVDTVHELLTGEAETAATPPRPDVEALERAAELVTDLKNISELAVGLSYAAVLFDDAKLASEVRELEIRSDALKNDTETLVIEAGDQVTEPARLRGLLHLATASEAICDAAVDIAEIVLRDGNVHPVFGQAVGESDELITTTTVVPESALPEATLAELELEERTGTSIMAIHRNTDWILAPTGETRLHSDDILIARGPEDGTTLLQEWASG